MTYKLDVKDRRILYELDKNARISNAQIAKKVGLSPEVVYYRVKKLEENVIAKYHTLVDYNKMGLIHFKICLKFNGISLQVEEEVYSKFAEINQVIWIAKCQGDWDCMLSCTVNSLKELDIIKDKLISLAHAHIFQKEISILSKVFAFPRRYLLEVQHDSFNMGGDLENLDPIDLDLLRLLSKQARKPVVEIAKELELTVKVVTYRIKKLLQSGVIGHFGLVLDYSKLGIHFYKSFFYLKNPDEKRVKHLLERLNNHPNLIYNLKVIGGWDLEPEFEFFDEQNFQKLIQELMSEFSDIIQRINTVNVIKEYKYNLFYK